MMLMTMAGRQNTLGPCDYFRSLTNVDEPEAGATPEHKLDLFAPDELNLYEVGGNVGK